jgi:EAL domain-containing protein (putative c-di-GMP-specific phosphodiesterase class I)
MMLDRAKGLPWLERDSADGGEPERIPLPAFPFTIGRDEASDLPIHSSRVSRKHAVILREDGRCSIRDLGSTNGTSVNGEKITEETPLGDGDVVLIADIEWSFFLGHDASPDMMATQAFRPDRSADDRMLARDLIHSVRRFHEMLVHRAIESLFEPIVDLDSGTVFGYESAVGSAAESEPSDADRLLLATECRVTSRLRRLRRMVAAEEAAALPGDAVVFVKLDATEIGAEGLAESLGRLQGACRGRSRLVAEIPDSAVSDTPYYREFQDRLRTMGIAVAHGGFASVAAQFSQREGFQPDYLKLAPSMVHGACRGAERQGPIASLVEAAGALGCQVIATGITSPDDESMCRDLGCRFGQGELFGGPRPIAEVVALCHA